MPQLYIIAGCNGAGKTTSSHILLPEIWNCKEFINADEIAFSLNSSDPSIVQIEAGRIMLQRIDEMLHSNTDFAIETTLSTRSFVPLISRAKKAGYRITLLFLWLPNPQIAIERVAARVQRGGHSIPREVIIRRHARGFSNLIKLYRPLCDHWLIAVNMNEAPFKIAEGHFHQVTAIQDWKSWQLFSDQAMQVEEPVVVYHSSYSDRLMAGLQKAIYLLIVDAASRDESLVIADNSGGCSYMPAKELLRKLVAKHLLNDMQQK